MDRHGMDRRDPLIPSLLKVWFVHAAARLLGSLVFYFPLKEAAECDCHESLGWSLSFMSPSSTGITPFYGGHTTKTPTRKMPVAHIDERHQNEKA
jgi:hypothetical protein